jgi:predicted Na+-dependent transporter
MCRDLLTLAGRHGPLFLLAGVLLGLAAAPLADAARPLMGVAVFTFTLGAFLKVDGAAFRRETARPAWIAVALAWTTLGVPLCMLGLVRLVGPEPGLAGGMTLAALAPPVASVAAIAAMLGLSAPVALIASVSATVLSPFYLPPLASLFAGYDLQIDADAMALRLASIVGGAALVAAVLRRHAGRLVADNPHAITGIAVIGLVVVGIGAMSGIQDLILDRPAKVARYLVLAFAVNAGFQAVGAALFWPAGRERALSVGLVSGNRSVTLVWAAAGPSLAGAPDVELFLAASVFPIFMLPALSRRPIVWMLRPRRLPRLA